MPATLSKTFLARVAPAAPQEWYDTRTITSIPWEVVCNHPLPTHVATQLLVSNLTNSALFARGREPSSTRIFSAAVAHVAFFVNVVQAHPRSTVHCTCGVPSNPQGPFKTNDAFDSGRDSFAAHVDLYDRTRQKHTYRTAEPIQEDSTETNL